MKYIRTGSEIYDTDDLYVCEELADKPYATKNGAWCIYKESIVAQADTIEELCDEFVVVDRDDFAIFHNLKWAKQTKGIVYGAIWVDWGLKYVAKINERGVLELL